MPLWPKSNICLTTVWDRLSVMSKFDEYSLIEKSWIQRLRNCSTLPHRRHMQTYQQYFFNITPPMKLSKYSEGKTKRKKKKYPIMAFFPTIFHEHDSKIAWSFSFGWALKAVERVFYFSSPVDFADFSRTNFCSSSIKLFRWRLTYANRVMFIVSSVAQ